MHVMSKKDPEIITPMEAYRNILGSLGKNTIKTPLLERHLKNIPKNDVKKP